MTEPIRLISTPESELERALLDAGRSYGASSSMRSKTLLALGLTAAATTTAPSAAAAGGSVTKATLSKVAVGILVLGAAVPAFRYFNRASDTAVAPAARPAPVASAAGLPAPIESAAIEPAPIQPAPVQPAPLQPVRVEAAVPPPATTARSSGNARAESKAVSDPPLTAELTALDAARTSLGHSD
ncbi:MAG TPA: hypothetical protein VGC79_29825, partial [Polyangiaceae bacterium]